MSKCVGFMKKQRGAGVYLLSVQGFCEREWIEADLVKAEELKNKFNHA